jgi:hypothetical protein
MPKRTRIVIGGVDTHGRTHHAAVIDQQGRLLGDRQFPSTQTREATPPSAGARSPGRRGFLVGVGGLAAAALVGPGGRWLGSEPTTSGSASSRQPGGSGFGLDLEARRARALQLRLTTAQQQARPGGVARTNVIEPGRGVPSGPGAEQLGGGRMMVG